ncbi:hypothetical protein GW891_05010 [bacterium]|nr:hypothetical protein [bacterium]
MRNPSNKNTVEQFIKEFGKIIKKPTSVYFTGGATAIWFGIRNTTIDVDISFQPDTDEMYKAIQLLKETLNMNIEIVSPSHFIPLIPGWDKRNIFIQKNNNVSFFHYDLYSQIIAKVQRGWEQDLIDATGFSHFSGFDMNLLSVLFQKIKPNLIRYPAIDISSLEKRLIKFIRNAKEK